MTGRVEFLDVDDVILGVDSVAVLIEGDLTREAVIEHLFQDVPGRGKTACQSSAKDVRNVFIKDT